MAEVLGEIGHNDEIIAVGLALVDYYQFLHTSKDVADMRSKFPFPILTLENEFRSWQSKIEPNSEDYQHLLSAWEQNNCVDRSLAVLEKTNREMYGDERNAYYLPLSDSWRPKILWDTIIWAENLLSTTRPTVVVSIERSSLARNILQVLCQKRSIPFYTFVTSRIGKRWIMREDFGYGVSEETYQNILKFSSNENMMLEAKKFIEKVTSEKLGSYPSWEALTVDKMKERRKRFLTVAYRDIRGFLVHQYSRFYLHPKVIAFKVVRLEQNYVKLTIWEGKKLLRSLSHALGSRKWGSMVLPSKPFLVWGLHFRPEGSVNVLGDGCDEIEELIKCANSLPKGLKIAVKENPEMFGYRASNFYQKLSSVPSLHLLDVTVPTWELIEKSVGVIGISGTILLEAAMYNKPSYAIGKPEFNKFLSGTGKEGVSEFLRKCCEGTAGSPLNEITNYIAYVHANSNESDVSYLSDSTHPDMQKMIKRFAHEIYEKIQVTIK